MSEKIVSKNRKVRFNYELIETYEAGMVLQGSEIKSIRAGQMSINEAYVKVDGDEAWLINANIAPYALATHYNHEPTRPRKLLLHKKEIYKLWDEVRKKSLTIVPTKVYLQRGKAKIEIALARGKRKYDKREAIKKRDTERDIKREFRRG